MDKFKNKYRISSARLQSWDYGSTGAYFITICTNGREYFFGEIMNDEMQLNAAGKLAEKYWLEIPDHFRFIQLANFVVMPNHVHGILIIDKTNNNDSDPVETRLIASLPTSPTPPPPPSPSPASPLPPPPSPTSQNQQSIKNAGGFAENKNPMLNENISRVIRWYKGRCTFEIRKIFFDFSWQSRFHDHIIRNAESFERIQFYIETNPMNWGKDKFNE